MMNHPDTSYLLAKSIQAERQSEAREYRLGHAPARRALGTRQAGTTLRCRLLALGGGNAQVKALTVLHAEGLFAVCR